MLKTRTENHCFPFELTTFWSVFHLISHFASQINQSWFTKCLDICTGKWDKNTEEERRFFAVIAINHVETPSLFPADLRWVALHRYLKNWWRTTSQRRRRWWRWGGFWAHEDITLSSLFSMRAIMSVCSQELSLDHVFGYRGFDCRNNLHYLNDGADIIFHTAAAAVIQNLSAGTVLMVDLWTLDRCLILVSTCG